MIMLLHLWLYILPHVLSKRTLLVFCCWFFCLFVFCQRHGTLNTKSFSKVTDIGKLQLKIKNRSKKQYPESLAILAILASGCTVNCSNNDDSSRLPNFAFGLETNCWWLPTPDRHLCAKKPIENLGNRSLANTLIKK